MAHKAYDVFYFDFLKDIYHFTLTLKYKIQIKDLEKDLVWETYNSKRIIYIQDYVS